MSETAEEAKANEETANNIQTGRPRGKNFTEDEDIALAMSYARVAVDPIRGQTGRKHALFWENLKKEYDTIMSEEAEIAEIGILRDVVQLRSRWNRHIYRDMKEFLIIQRRMPKIDEDESDAMYINRVKEEYRRIHERRFRFEKCVEILSTLPDFDPNQAQEDEIQRVEEREAAAATKKKKTMSLEQAEQARKKLRMVEDRITGNKHQWAATTTAIEVAGACVKNYTTMLERTALMEHLHKLLDRYDRLGMFEKATEVIEKMEAITDHSMETMMGKKKVAAEAPQNDDDDGETSD